MGEENKKSLWLPEAFKDEGSIYFMSAKHRGDMYHLRAAMQLEGKGYSLVLCEADMSEKRTTKDTEDYLKHSTRRNKKHFFIVPWANNIIRGEKKPEEKRFHDCCLDGNTYDGKDIQRLSLRIYGEFDSTKLIADASKSNGLPKQIWEGMFLLTNGTKEYLQSSFKTIFEEWKIYPDNERKSTILAVNRETGRSIDGVYPELDTGNGISMIRAIAEKTPKLNGKCKLSVISCGLAEEKQISGIGEYWKKLPTVKQIEESTGEKDVTKRDVEAYFLYYASQENEKSQYFKMAIGLRSGVMDLFTFMGIPTVSIGLRNMVGEERHALLAGKGFKRVNIQYDTPRHSTTAYVKNRVDRIYPPLLNSPYWDGDAPTDFQIVSSVKRTPTPKELKKKINKNKKKEMKAVELKSFSPFDEYVVKIGMRLACQEYIGWPISVKSTTGSFPDIITTHDARFCYLSEDEDENVGKLLSDRKRMDLSSIMGLRANLHDPQTTLQLSEDQFSEFYQRPHEKDWKKVER
ncbi:hypothetical protein Hte_002631 [Hypoxylon texense]